MLQLPAGGVTNIYDSGYLYARRINNGVIQAAAGSTVTNAGRIRLAYQIEGGGISTDGEFENLAGADIWIQDARLSALAVAGSDANFTNQGAIRFTGSDFESYGLYIGQGGQMHNTSTGTIMANNLDPDDSIIGLFNNGNLNNDGNIDIACDNLFSAVLISGGDLVNAGHLHVDGDNDVGIRIYSNGQLINDGGTVEVNGLNESIFTYGSVTNANCGLLKTHGPVRLQGSSDVTNYGYWEYGSGSVAILSPSQVTNEAVIYDLSNAFAPLSSTSLFDNNGVVLNRQNYIPQDGETYPQVFSLGGTSWGYIHPYWTISPNSNTYHSEYLLYDNSLKFGSLPYQIDNLYAEVGINGCQSRTYRIPFAGAANRPRSHEDVPPAEVLIEQIVDQKDLSPSSTTVFPNPIQSDFQLSLSTALELPAQIQLFDMNGRQLAQWTVAAETRQIQLNRPAHTPSGIYLLNILHANGEVEQQRLVFE
ncbi:MAG: T9SS type A sorting domain-containing protein [Bacteroidota bacterium]